MTQEIREVQHGIWIDEQLIRDAGLGDRLQILVQPGEIRILPGKGDRAQPPSARGWEVFRALGKDAPTGNLANSAEDHDSHLYGKNQRYAPRDAEGREIPAE